MTTKKFLDDAGLSTFWTKVKAYITSALSGKQDTLVSGTNIKTVGSTTLLGSGNIALPTKVSELTNDSGFTTNTGTITAVQANGTNVATSGTANIPSATTSRYGVTQLSSSTSSTSTTLAATPSAVKAAYDLANGKQNVISVLSGQVTFVRATGSLNLYTYGKVAWLYGHIKPVVAGSGVELATLSVHPNVSPAIFSFVGVSATFNITQAGKIVSNTSLVSGTDYIVNISFITS